MKRTAIIAALSSFLSIAAIAQVTQQKPKPQPINAATSLPSVDQIIDRYVQAIGGEVAVGKLTTRVMKGSLIAPGGNAPIEIYMKAPDKFLIVINSPVAGVSQNGFNGKIAWSQNRQRGLREMSGPEVENFKREYDLRREIKLKELHPKMSIRGEEKIGEKDTYRIEAVTADGTTEAMFFDMGNGLLIRHDVTVRGTTLQAYFEDYKEVNGVKLPHTIRRSRPDFSFTYKFDEVKQNIAIEDTKFDKPTTQ